MQNTQAGLTTNPITGEALAVLAGGGIEHLDEGYNLLMLMRKKQINEYYHRLQVVGLGDRLDRMDPEMRELITV